MTDPYKPAIVLCTGPDEATARRLAGMLVESRLAACVNIVPGVRSVYEWQGRIEDDEEVLMVIKTDGGRFDDLCERLTQAHPYDVPEILKLDVDGGLPAYLEWMANWLRNDK
ncbi:MAG: divalent-cation tolerance protein CutA [Gammaproteobacteria bacterium]|nr:divalent-cation tolerance protein CutA [Gammaproteobacteria bacterium]